MLWIKAFHIVFMVAWFAGLMYLPRLFVYHRDADDHVSKVRFRIMEWRLYYIIMTPAAILTTLSGIWLLWQYFPVYVYVPWMHAKISLVVLLWIYHGYCGYLIREFEHDTITSYSTRFLRIFNEIPTVLLIAIVIMVVVQP